MKRTILIVDDDESIKVSLKLLLEEKYIPVTASSGEDALDILKRICVDAVLLDVKMKGMDGIETLRKIREQHRNLIVIMLTVTENKNTKSTAFHLGADDYLNKPYNKDELLIVL